MSIKERIIISMYFPQFQSPNCSRFESFFMSIIKKDNPLNKNNNKSKIIYPEKIVRNEDKRTSLIIKGIPMDMSKKEVRNIIEKYGNINYLYLTKDTTSEDNNTSIAYVNVINYKSIIPLFMNLRNYKLNSNGQLYDLKIMYSPVQGKKQLKQYVKQQYFCEYFE